MVTMFPRPRKNSSANRLWTECVNAVVGGLGWEGLVREGNFVRTAFQPACAAARIKRQPPEHGQQSPDSEMSHRVGEFVSATWTFPVDPLQKRRGKQDRPCADADHHNEDRHMRRQAFHSSEQRLGRQQQSEQSRRQRDRAGARPFPQTVIFRPLPEIMFVRS